MFKPFGRFTIDEKYTKDFFTNHLQKWYGLSLNPITTNTFLLATHMSNKGVYHFHFFINISDQDKYEDMNKRFKETSFKKIYGIKGVNKWNLQASLDTDDTLKYIYYGYKQSCINNNNMVIITDYNIGSLNELIKDYKKVDKKVLKDHIIKNIQEDIFSDIQKQIKLTLESKASEFNLPLETDFDTFGWQFNYQKGLEKIIIDIMRYVQYKHKKRYRYKILSEMVLDALLMIKDEIDPSYKQFIDGIEVIRARTILANLNTFYS